ncbi:MAG: hypothetical protein CMJ78_05810 [Planctomycetaceae bacterium]|nr:hypothetical protein [Planctomycetaceae bacterium]
MLSLVDNKLDRRAFMGIGGLGLGGLSLAQLLAAKANAGTGNKPLATGKSVIFLLQHGGPTQFETFDPKLNVPDGIRTVGGVCSTATPGVTFGSSMARTAKYADKLAVVRSYTTGSARHSIEPLIGQASRKANIGSLYSRIAGTNHPDTGLPTNITLFPNSIDPEALGPDERFGKFSQTGELGSAFEPFAPGGGSNLQSDMKLNVSSERFNDRNQLLASLDQLRWNVDRSGAVDGFDKYRQQAFEMVLRGVAGAFDFSDESPKTLARYDTRQFIRENAYTDKTNGRKGRRWYQNNALALGHELLLARRLCEAGCGFVTVATRFVWDMHADANNVGVGRGKEAVIDPFDHAISALIEDCEERGLSDDILLVCVGEMGRTPRINKKGGRDHWARLAPLMLYGGGITQGQIIGQSTRDGGEPLADAVDSENLIATILNLLLDIPELRVRTDLPNDLARFTTSGEPIPRLFS